MQILGLNDGASTSSTAPSEIVGNVAVMSKSCLKWELSCLLELCEGISAKYLTLILNSVILQVLCSRVLCIHVDILYI